MVWAANWRGRGGACTESAEARPGKPAPPADDPVRKNREEPGN
jgi:hypothetical protein